MYTITYTQSICTDLDDDFTLKSIVALTLEELSVILHNITEFFGGTVIDVQENVKKKTRRKATRREQRPKVSREKGPYRYY